MEGYYVGQLILVGVLALITAYYAYQTRRQVNLLKQQIRDSRDIKTQNEKEIALNRISNWASNIYLQIINPSKTDIKEVTGPKLSEALMPFVVESLDILSNARMFGVDFVKTIQEAIDALM